MAKENAREATSVTQVDTAASSLSNKTETAAINALVMLGGKSKDQAMVLCKSLSPTEINTLAKSENASDVRKVLDRLADQ